MGADVSACAGAQVMMYNTYRDGMDVTVKHLVPDKLPHFVLRKASDAQQAAKAITQAAEVKQKISCCCDPAWLVQEQSFLK